MLVSDVAVSYPSPDRAVIAITRDGSLNSLNSATLRRLREAAQEVSQRPLKVVTLRGEGRAFCAGADFALLGGEEGPPFQVGELGREMTEAVEAIPAVTIAVLHGAVVGGGVVLAACCDLRVAAEDTYFSIPEVDVGLPLGWAGVPRLMREIGPALTRELVMTCRPFTAEEALRAGFVNRVAPAAQLEAAADELAEVLCAKSAYALRTVKRTISEAAEQLAPAWGRSGDSRLLAGAAQDPESRRAMDDYMSRRRS